MTNDEIRRRWEQESLLLLERSPEAHRRIAARLEDGDAAAEEAAEIATLMEAGLAHKALPEGRRQAALIVWQELKSKASPAHARQAEELVANLAHDPWAIVYLKKLFKILASQQGWRQLLDSAYLSEP